MPVAAHGSAGVLPVNRVLCVGSDLKMARVHAEWVVAFVADKVAVGDWPAVHGIRQAMSIKGSLSYAEAAIAAVTAA